MLAVQKAPKKWSDILYQEHITKVLKNAIIDGKVPNNIILGGPTGIGKTTIAKVLTASIVCEDLKEGEPCGVCSSCTDIFEDRFQRSVRYVNGITDNGIDFYRSELDTMLNHGNIFNRKRVLIIDEVHGLSPESLQAFLLPAESNKNKDIYFIFATTEDYKVKDTLSSRCLSFKLNVPNELDISRYLVNTIQEIKVRAPEQFLTDGIFEIACESEGSLRKALHTLEKVLLSKDFSVENVRKQVEAEIETDVISITKELVAGKKPLAILNLEKVLSNQDPTKVYGRLLRQLVDLYRYKGLGIKLGRPYYEKFIDKNFKDTPVDTVKPIINTLLDIRKVSGYYIDRNILIYKLLEG